MAQLAAGTRSTPSPTFRALPTCTPAFLSSIACPTTWRLQWRLQRPAPACTGSSLRTLSPRATGLARASLALAKARRLPPARPILPRFSLLCPSTAPSSALRIPGCHETTATSAAALAPLAPLLRAQRPPATSSSILPPALRPIVD
jgi:hypothetical protein